MIDALLWDVDGTLAETERDGHLVAFNQAFEDEGLPWRWDTAHYGKLLRVTGGYERLLHDMASRADAPLAAEREPLARRLHRRKNERYADLVRSPGIALRDGVRELIDEGQRRGVRQAIVTTTSRANVDALLARHFGRGSGALEGVFEAIVCGEDVRSKKPDPEAYLLALERLRLPALRCVAIEDSPGGVAAARAASVPVIVTRSVFFAADTVEGAIAIGPGLHRRDGWRPSPQPSTAADRITLDDLSSWHEGMAFASAHDGG